MKKILITGAAGFIGFHLSKLLCKNNLVTGIDTLNNYYDVSLKMARLDILRKEANFSFQALSICDKDNFDDLFSRNQFDIVINLAAQAGVRYSIEKPYQYIDSNLIGFINVLEACRNNPVEHLIFASSSSVYGANKEVPFSTTQQTDQPLSLYAATKKANEVMAHSYAAMYKIPCTGLRFFTVYGPYGRPDMAYFSFTKDIMEGKPIKIFNEGKMMRDFTFIDDITSTIALLLKKPPVQAAVPYHIYNIGNNNPVSLMNFINILEELTGKNAVKEFHPMQSGDMEKTYADIDDLCRNVGYKPSTDIKDGLLQFVTWYKEYYQMP